MTSSSGVTGARDQSLESRQSDWSTKFCKLFLRVADKQATFRKKWKTVRWKIGQRPLRVTSTRLKKTRTLLWREKERNISPNLSPVEILLWCMVSNRSQITVKRLTCCNILGAEIPTRIKVRSFENIVRGIILDYTYLEDHNEAYVCVVVWKFGGKFLTQLSQRDARSRNVLKCLGYCIKQINSILPWVCTLITHRGRQNVVRTSVTLLACGS